MSTLKDYQQEVARAKGFKSLGLVDKSLDHEKKAEQIQKVLTKWAEKQLESHDHVCQGTCRKCAQAFSVLRYVLASNKT